MTTYFLIVLNFGSFVFLITRLLALPGFDFQNIRTTLYTSLTFTIYQAVLSTVISVGIGFLAAPGYCRLKTFRKITRWILLFPGLMSPVLSVLGLLVSIKNFPFGMTGIILGHVFLNAGLCTVWIGDAYQVIEEKWSPVNFVLGGGPWLFFRKVIWPQILPTIFNLSAVVLSFCLSSFAIPYVLGGSPQYATLEVFMYERLRAEGDLNSAVFVGLVQSAIQFLIFLLILKKVNFTEVKTPRAMLKLSSFGIKLLPTIVVTVLTLAPLLRILQMGIPQWPNLRPLMSSYQFRECALISLLTALGIGFSIFTLLLWTTSTGVKSFFLKLPALSGVVVGLGLLVLMTEIPSRGHLKFIALLIYGHLCVIFLPILRLSWPQLSKFRNRYEPVIRQLEASKFLALRKIYLMGELQFFISAAGLAAIWSMGEFSVSRILSGEYSTLPIFISNLIGSYRLELASGVATLLLFMTVSSLTFFEALSGLD